MKVLLKRLCDALALVWQCHLCQRLWQRNALDLRRCNFSKVLSVENPSFTLSVDVNHTTAPAGRYSVLAEAERKAHLFLAEHASFLV